MPNPKGTFQVKIERNDKSEAEQQKDIAQLLRIIAARLENPEEDISGSISSDDATPRAYYGVWLY